MAVSSSRPTRRLPPEARKTLMGQEKRHAEVVNALRAANALRADQRAFPSIGNKGMSRDALKTMAYKNPFRYTKMSLFGHEFQVKSRVGRMLLWLPVSLLQLVWTPISWSGRFSARMIARMQYRISGKERKALEAKIAGTPAVTPEQMADLIRAHNENADRLSADAMGRQGKKNPNDPTPLVTKKSN